MDVNLPDNVVYFYAGLVPIGLLDWLGFDFARSKWVAKLLFTFDYKTQDIYKDRVFNEQSRLLGWDSHNFILIMGSFFTLWAAYLVRMTYLALFD